MRNYKLGWKDIIGAGVTILSAALSVKAEDGWSAWQTSQCNPTTGQRSRTEYNVNTVKTWGTCTAGTAPNETWITYGKYDPGNCAGGCSYKQYQCCDCNSCTSYSPRYGGCTGWTNYWCCCCAGKYSCSYYSCGNTATCWKRPSEWNNETTWTTTAASSNASQKVTTRTTYSCPLNYTINFNGNGATSGSMSAQTASFVGNSTLKTNAFVRDGYVFLGWAKTANGGPEFTDGQTVTATGVGTTAGGSITLYAVWLEKNVVSVSDVHVTYNGQQQTPNFFQLTEGISGTQSSLFDWNICETVACAVATSGNRTSAKDVLRSNNSVVGYSLGVKLKSGNDYIMKDGQTTVKEKIVHFQINPFSIGSGAPNYTLSSAVTVTGSNLTYNGEQQNPSLTVKANLGTITETVPVDHYSIQTVKFNSSGNAYEEKPAINVGTYDVLLTGRGNYSGIAKVINAFQILPRAISASGITYEYANQWYWTGSQIVPVVVVKDNGRVLTKCSSPDSTTGDYWISYSNNVNVTTSSSKAVITITGKNNYNGTKTLNFDIVNSEMLVETTNGNATYSGTATDGGAKINKIVDSHTNVEITGATIGYTQAYTTAQDESAWSGLTYSNAQVPKVTNVGKYYVYYKIQYVGHNPVYGQLIININKSSNKIDFKDDAGNEVTSITLKYPESKVLNLSSAAGNIKINCGTQNGQNINGASCSYVNMSLSNNKLTITPNGRGTGKEVVSIYTETNANTLGDTKSVEINLLEGTMYAKVTPFTGLYDAKPHSIGLKVYKNENYTNEITDATITYFYGESLSVNPTFVEAGQYLVSFVIEKPCYETIYGNALVNITSYVLTSSNVSLERTSYTYTGSQIKPPVVVTVTLNGKQKTLVEGTDYTVSYENNVNVSTGSTYVVVTGIGNYQGVVKKAFEITPAAIEYRVIDESQRIQDDDGNFHEKVLTLENGAYRTSHTYSGYAQNHVRIIPEIPMDAEIKYSLDGVVYDRNTMPKFKDAGDHTIYFQIVRNNYQTVKSKIILTIEKAILEIPELWGEYIYTGKSQEPQWIHYNSQFLKQTGDTRATQPGTYTVTFSIKPEEAENVRWINSPDVVNNKVSKQWTIQYIDVRSHEEVVIVPINTNEEKQLLVEGADSWNGDDSSQDGDNLAKVEFLRPGYIQIGWVEDCKDIMKTAGYYDRECDYSNWHDIGASLSGNLVSEKLYSTVKGFAPADITTEDVDYKLDTETERVIKTEDGETQGYLDLYAIWTASTYRVKYDLCGDDGFGCGRFLTPNQTVIVAYDQQFNVENPVRDGYHFKGWKITGMDESPHGIYTFVTSDTEYVTSEEWTSPDVVYKNLTSLPDATVTFTAIWEPIKYTVNYLNNADTPKDDCGVSTSAGVTGSVESQILYYDIQSTLNRNNYQLEGYTFLGWSLDKETTEYNFLLACTNGRAYNLDYIDLGVVKAYNFAKEEGEVVNLYAVWAKNKETPFTVTYWQQNIGAPGDYAPQNYTKVGVEYYTAPTDTLVTINPYSFEGNNQKYSSTKVQDATIVDAHTVKATVAVNSGNTNDRITSSYDSDAKTKHKYIKTMNAKNSLGQNVSVLSDDIFKGFSKVSKLPNSINTACIAQGMNSHNSSVGLNSLTFMVKPDGSLNIDVYYTRNTYTVTFQMKGGKYDNPSSAYELNSAKTILTKPYQISLILQNPTDTSGSTGLLGSGTNDDGGTNNSGFAEFEGWYYQNTAGGVVTDVIITGVNGEAIKDETLYARWKQYRYTGNGNNENSWTSWGKKNE